MTLRKRLYLTLEPTIKGGKAERIFEIILITTIVLNIVAIVLHSVPEFARDHQLFFRRFEIYSLIFFAIEYVARIYSIVEDARYADPIRGRLKFALTPLAIIDLLSFLPALLTFMPLDLMLIRIFRLLSVFRMLKITRYLHALKIFKRVIQERKEQLILSFLFIFFVLIVISFIMFYVEGDAQPGKFSSIPATMWWGISTLTTVGYGDMVPITPLGKFLGGIFAFAGVGLIALPAAILSSGFFQMLQKPMRKKKKLNENFCPHCGKEIHKESL